MRSRLIGRFNVFVRNESSPSALVSALPDTLKIQAGGPESKRGPNRDGAASHRTDAADASASKEPVAGSTSPSRLRQGSGNLQTAPETSGPTVGRQVKILTNVHTTIYILTNTGRAYHYDTYLQTLAVHTTTFNYYIYPHYL